MSEDRPIPFEENPWALSHDQISEIETRWPSIAVSGVETIAHDWRQFRDYGEQAPRQFEVRARLRDLRRDVGKLSRRLLHLARNDQVAWAAVLLAQSRNECDALGRTIRALTDLEDVFARTEEFEWPFAVVGMPDDVVFMEVVHLVAKAGLKVDCSPTGPLINLLRIIFDAVGEETDPYNFAHYRVKVGKKFFEKLNRLPRQKTA